jgi:cell division septum initiation protein DivIVA
MNRTGLLGGPRITGEQARRVNFPSQVLGGYRPGDVEAFRTRVTTELDTLSRGLDEIRVENTELAAEVTRLNEELGRLRAVPRPAAVSGERAIDILSVAQTHADGLVAGAQQEANRVVGGARHEGGQIVEHARQQAAGIMRQAAAEGAAEKARVIASATAETRRQVDLYTQLAKTMRESLGGQVDGLLKNLSEWEQVAHGGADALEPATA